jgi:UDP-2-acetamido-2,6-beta-L-arabino-hexul-4-ose reductase
MKILITGAKGFIGKNLAAALKNRRYENIYEYDIDTGTDTLEKFTEDCDMVFHLAGVNRTQNADEFMLANSGFTSTLLSDLKKHHNRAPVILTSSVQAGLHNPYGESKKAAEELLLAYGRENGAATLIYRLPNVFGKWCRPCYNSVVATFCSDISAGMPITIDDPETVLHLVYIDDVVSELIDMMDAACSIENNQGSYYHVEPVYSIKLGDLAAMIRSFKDSRASRYLPDLSDDFKNKLYATYLTCLPLDTLRYPLQMHEDPRGSFTEFMRAPGGGQISVNISKSGVTRGNHLHEAKIEKFLAVSGQGVISLRRVDGGGSVEYPVSGDRLEVVDIPPGYAHSIKNTGDSELITVIWASKPFDLDKPDTYPFEV